MFARLLHFVRRPEIQHGNNALYLYGPSGTGKSHLLAALVCQLVIDNERMVYIPDCSRLIAEDPFPHLQNAFMFAFHNDSHAHSIIVAAQTMEDLLWFRRSRPPCSFYVIVDQRNALEFLDINDAQTKPKKVVANVLNAIGGGQKYIYSAASNEQASRDADRKQSNITTLYFWSGMTDV